MNSHIFLKLVILGSISISIFSCSKDRLFPVTEETNPFKDKVFENTRNLSVLSNAASKATEYTISSASDLPITTKKGTQLWINNFNLRTQQNGLVSYPFDIEIIELYSPKDMILHRKPTVSYDKLLTTGGAIYLNVKKDGENLRVNPNYRPTVSIPTKKVDDTMWLFYEGYEISAGPPTDRVTWVEAQQDTIDYKEGQERYPVIVGGKGAYEIFPKQFGWINCDKFFNYTGDKTYVSFVSPKVGLESIAIFMVFPTISSVIQVYNGKSLEVPVGEEVKIIAVAQTKDGLIFSFFKDIKVTKEQTIEIVLTETTENKFLAALDKLQFDLP